MPYLAKLFLFLGAVNAFLAVGFGAFGAHALRARISPEMLTVWHTGNQYHFYHALGLVAVGLLSAQLPPGALMKWTGWLMLLGIVLFSGSLYLLALSGVRWLGAVTPFGGTAFLAAWLLLAIAVLRG